MAGLSIVTLVVGSAVLRAVQPRIDADATVRRAYVAVCTVAGLGLLGLAGAVDAVTGSVAVLVVATALPLTRTFASVWVNRQCPDDVRATVHSLLAQAEYLGEIGCGLAIAAVARLADPRLALLACAVLLAVAALGVQRGAVARTAGRPEA